MKEEVRIVVKTIDVFLTILFIICQYYLQILRGRWLDIIILLFISIWCVAQTQDGHQRKKWAYIYKDIQ